jgi:hypothetical protein
MKREKMRFLTLLCILIGFSSLLGFTVKASEGSGSTITPLSRRYDISFGAPGAPVEITMYFSPTCHACSRYEQTILPEIQARFIETGKVYFVMRLLPFHRLDFAVARLIWYQGPSHAYELAQLFLSHQEDWLDPLTQDKKARVKLLKAKIKEVAEKLGMSPKELKKKLEIEEDDQDAFLKLFALQNGFTVEQILHALQDNTVLEEALTANHIQAGESRGGKGVDFAPAFVMSGKPWDKWIKTQDIQKELNKISR